MPNEELDEQSLFDEATSDEPEVQEAEVADLKAEVAEKVEAEQARDEAGRFAKSNDEAAVEKLITPAEKLAVDDSRIPEWRREEIAAEKNRAVDEANALRERLSALEAERSNWQRQQTAERKAVEEKAAKPDPLLDPEGYEAYLEAKFEDKRIARDRETSLRSAHKAYKTEFEEAYSAAQRQVDPALKARMQQSDDPGETLIQWHRERKTQAEIGGDLNAYKQKHRDELMKDPEFRKAAMEAWRNETAPQNNGRPRVNLPPSLNGASRSNSMLRSTDGDVPDGDLWNEITAQ